MVTRFWYKSPKICENLRAKFESRYISERVVVGYMSPSGKLSIGVLPPNKELKAEQEYEAERPKVVYFTKNRWDAIEGVVSEPGQYELASSPVGLSSAQNHHKPIPRRNGLRGITGNGKSKVYEGAKLLQGRYSGRLGFYTLTCPYVDPCRVYEFNRNIGEISRRWFQELRRMYDRKNSKFSYVSVLEIQSDRYEKSGLPVLHIHYVAPCFLPGSREWVLTATELRYLWMRLCAQVVGGEVDTSASLDAQIVKRSASGYLAKYMAKGYACVGWIAQICPSQLPGQWWSMSANVRAAIKKLTIQIPQALAEWYFADNNFAEDDDYHIANIHEIVLANADMSRRIGLSATMNKAGVARMIDPYKWLEVMWSL